MPQSPTTAALRYGGTLLGVFAVTMVRVALDPLVEENQPFVVYYLATAVTAMLAGLGPALLSLVLGSILAPYLFVRPRYTFPSVSNRVVFGLAFYWVTGAVTTCLSQGLRAARRRAVEGRDALRAEMAERQRAEASLRDGELRFRALIEHSSDVISMTDARGAIAYMSPSIRRMSGFEAEELVGTPAMDLVHPDDRPLVAAALAAASEAPGEPVASSFRMRHKDGSWRLVENVTTDFLRDPSVSAFVSTARDVTESRAMEDQARRAEARFRAFMDHSPAISFLKDESGRYVWGNSAWARQFGRPASELLGRDDRDLWPEDAAQIIRASDRAALDSDGTVETLEAVSGRHFMCVKFPMEHEGQRFVGGKVLDVTDRVEAEAAVRRSEALLIALADSMPQIVWAAGPDGRVDYFNRRWFEFTGLTPERTFQGDGWAEVLHPEDRDRTVAAWRASLGSGQPYEIEYRLRDGRTGAYRWHLGRALAVRDDAGALVRWYGTCTDIDDQKRAIQAAEAADQAKTRFLAVLSHELRTPLTPVLLGVSAALEDPGLSGDLRGTLEMARRNVALEARLIDDLLDVNRIASGKLELRPEPVDAHELIARAVEICRPDLDAAGLALALDLRAPEAAVSADSARLQQAFWNLLQNAVKFTPRGGKITVRTRLEGDGESRRLAVEVQDTGIGIDPAFLPRMFEAFEQGEASPWTRRYGGLGLGLAIGRTVIERHGGRLDARSEGPGRGATFRIELPTIPVPAPAPAPAGAATPARAAPAAPAGRGPAGSC